jgi:predicted DNA binding CopG/RHH family protein
MSKASFEWDVKKDLKIKPSTACCLRRRNTPLRIHTVSLLKTSPIVRRKNGTTASEQLRAVFSQSDLRTVGGPSASSVPAIGGKASKSMNTKIRYTDEPLGDLKVIPDFLPAPEELAFRDDTVKVTITLSRSSVEFFKHEAKKHHTQYQKMIRRLLDVYTQKHQQPLTKRSTGRGKQRRAAELSR